MRMNYLKFCSSVLSVIDVIGSSKLLEKPWLQGKQLLFADSKSKESLS